MAKNGNTRRIADMNTVYVWGANLNNVHKRHGSKLNGGGMAGTQGPTKGYAHSNYIGVVTILYPEYGDTLGKAMRSIETSFKRLTKKKAQGYNIAFPYMPGVDKEVSDVARFHGLGKGIAANKKMSDAERQDYETMQAYIERKIKELVHS